MKLSQRKHGSRAAIALLAFAGIASSNALAQTASLGVDVTPKILVSGQSAKVGVRAHFPIEGYAFASSMFDVLASEPAWTIASSGAIAGDKVLNAFASQVHNPFLGVLADSSNPLRVWSGVFKPTSEGPALVQISAVPSSFWYYPSDMTSSAAPASAHPGVAWLMVNPIRAGAAAAAPVQGTAVDDVVVDGRIITARVDDLLPPPPTPRILVGLLLHAVQKVHVGAVRIGFDESPQSFSVAVQVDGTNLPHESLSLNFTEIESSSALDVRSGFPIGTNVQVSLLRNGKPVGGFNTPSSDTPLFRVDRLPEVLTSSAEPVIDRAGSGGKPSIQVALGMSGAYDEPVRVHLPNGSILIADTIHVGSRMRGVNNLKQLGVGIHAYTVEGARTMTIEPLRP